jgi:type II secretory pathway pseudopilin PulG
MIRRPIEGSKIRLFACRRGLTLIGLIVALAILSLSAGMAGTAWSVLRQKDREKELLFRGNQYRRAIASYYNRSDIGKNQYPSSLEDLLEDGRGLDKVKHIRQLFPDPMTDLDWQTVPAPEGGIMGVRSQSSARPFKEKGFSTENRSFEKAKQYSDWQFVFRPAKTGAGKSAPGKSGGQGQEQGEKSAVSRRSQGVGRRF